MASSNTSLNRGRRRDSGPQLQVQRRSSASRASTGISRLAAATNSPSTTSAARAALSTSAPEHTDEAPLLTHGKRNRQKTYGTLEETLSSTRARKATGGKAGDANKATTSRLIRAGTQPLLPTASTHGTRSFLVPANAGPSGGKAVNTMPSLAKHQRTTKTSQKLVVLPSAPQTKPLSKQLVLLDEEQETSDDAAHPHGMLPPKRPQKSQRNRTSSKGRIPPPRIQEPDSEEVHEDTSHPSQMRIRDYKSPAERMSKEERKKAGYKRITAYCIAEGLRMKELAGFLKREHNVLPRVFDEAIYAMYHLPLLPGYGPQTNVRSSAPPPPPIPTEGAGFSKSILTRLEEAEEDGYHGPYFPTEQDLINLEENRTHTPPHNRDQESNHEPSRLLPGMVEPATVDEVRENDGYVTSSSLPRDNEMGRVDEGTGDEFTYEYNPYPSESSSPSTTIQKPVRYEESTMLSAAGPYYTDSGVETDDPGAQTDPGLYRRSSSPIPLNGKAKDDGSSPSDGDMTASIMTAVPIHRVKSRDFASEGVHEDYPERPPNVRASTFPLVQEQMDGLLSDELHGGNGVPASAYEEQMVLEENKERTDEERARLVQAAYEETLERERERERERQLDDVGEVVFFDYGVVVFFGLAEQHERDILEDIQEAGVVRRLIPEDEWEVEECHFAHDPKISYPRIYNDFFTLKSRSHLLKLSIAHALAQSTLLARYETIAQRTLSSPLTLAIPRQMAATGALQLRRHEALKLTGRLFKLRRDVNLVSNVLDVPELFWSEASLEDLYDAVRDYMEIGPRVESLNEKLGVASDFLDAIHDHLNNSAMERITWIIIWLIVVAALVELGEIIARLVFHSGVAKDRAFAAAAVRSLSSSAPPTPLSKEEALRILERIMDNRP